MLYVKRAYVNSYQNAKLNLFPFTINFMGSLSISKRLNISHIQKLAFTLICAKYDIRYLRRTQSWQPNTSRAYRKRLEFTTHFRKEAIHHANTIDRNLVINRIATCADSEF